MFLVVDLSFFCANLLKIVEGGWFPLVIAGAALHGDDDLDLGPRTASPRQRASGAMPLDTLIATLRPDRPVRVPGTAIFMTAQVDNVPAALLHNMKHNKVLHERIVLMTVQTEDVPHVARGGSAGNPPFRARISTPCTIRYGFLDEPDIPRALALCRVGGSAST